MNELKQLIYEKGYTIESLSRRIGVNSGTVSRIINHPKENKRQSDTFFKIARALKVTETEVRRMTGNELERDHPLISAIADKGMTLQEFAEWSGVAYYTIIGIVSRRVPNPHESTMQYMADMLDVPMERITP